MMASFWKNLFRRATGPGQTTRSTIACDVDGTLIIDGDLNMPLFQALMLLKEQGHEIAILSNIPVFPEQDPKFPPHPFEPFLRGLFFDAAVDQMHFGTERAMELHLTGIGRVFPKALWQEVFKGHNQIDLILDDKFPNWAPYDVHLGEGWFDLWTQEILRNPGQDPLALATDLERDAKRSPGMPGQERHI